MLRYRRNVEFLSVEPSSVLVDGWIRSGVSATPEELIAHVRTKIASYKAPREVVIKQELPKTSTGKIQKFVLRDAEWAGRAQRVHG